MFTFFLWFPFWTRLISVSQRLHRRACRYTINPRELKHHIYSLFSSPLTLSGSNVPFSSTPFLFYFFFPRIQVTFPIIIHFLLSFTSVSPLSPSFLPFPSSLIQFPSSPLLSRSLCSILLSLPSLLFNTVYFPSSFALFLLKFFISSFFCLPFSIRITVPPLSLYLPSLFSSCLYVFILLICFFILAFPYTYPLCSPTYTISPSCSLLFPHHPFLPRLSHSSPLHLSPIPSSPLLSSSFSFSPSSPLHPHVIFPQVGPLPPTKTCPVEHT